MVVYSRCPKVRLYLNNKLVGEKPTTLKQDFKGTFAVRYVPGLLKAVGVEKDKETGSAILRTAGTAAKIKLTPYRSLISANGEDLSFVTIEITDAHGVIQPNAGNRLFFKLNGPGVIAGIGNANLKDPDKYAGNTRKVWHGRALAVIKSTQNTGTIRLHVSSAGLPDATLTIKAVKK